MDRVMADSVTDAMARCGFKFAEQIFYEAAKAAQFPDAKDRTMALYRVWIREGYQALPDFCKDWVLKACEGALSHGCASEAL